MLPRACMTIAAMLPCSSCVVVVAAGNPRKLSTVAPWLDPEQRRCVWVGVWWWGGGAEGRGDNDGTRLAPSRHG